MPEHTNCMICDRAICNVLNELAETKLSHFISNTNEHLDEQKSSSI